MRERVHIALRHDRAQPWIVDQFGEAARAVGGDDGRAERERFGDDGGQPLIDRRQREHARARHDGGGIAQIAVQGNPVGKVMRGDRGFHLRLFGTVPHDI